MTKSRYVFLTPVCYLLLFCLAIYFNQLSGNKDSEIRFGIEYKLMESFKIRTGLQSNPNRFSAGFEFGNIKLANLYTCNFSYSFLTHHVLPTTHQFSLSVKF